jgi:hypothetical protein
MFVYVFGLGGEVCRYCIQEISGELRKKRKEGEGVGLGVLRVIVFCYPKCKDVSISMDVWNVGGGW